MNYAKLVINIHFYIQAKIVNEYENLLLTLNLTRKLMYNVQNTWSGYSYRQGTGNLEHLSKYKY